MNKRFLWLLTAVLFAAACSSDSPNQPNTDTPPAVPDAALLKIDVPAQAPAEVQGYASTVNAMTNLGGTYLNLAGDETPVSQNGQWVWTYTAQSLTIKLVAEIQDEETVAWQAIVDGSEPNTGITFSNWTAISGTAATDGSSGTWQIYNVNQTSVAATASWETDANGNRSSTLAFGDFTLDATGTAAGDYTLTVLKDGIRAYYVEWSQSAGSGSWTKYAADGESIVDSGTF